ATGQFDVYFDIDGTIYHSTVNGSIAQNQSKKTFVTVAVPPSVNSLLKIKVDDGNVISESDETNNTVIDSLYYDFSLSRLENTPIGTEMFWDYVQPTFHPVNLTIGFHNHGLFDA